MSHFYVLLRTNVEKSEGNYYFSFFLLFFQREEHIWSCQVSVSKSSTFQFILFHFYFYFFHLFIFSEQQADLGWTPQPSRERETRQKLFFPSFSPQRGEHLIVLNLNFKIQCFSIHFVGLFFNFLLISFFCWKTS